MVKLEVWDSPDRAGVITDAMRCLGLGLDGGLSSTLDGHEAGEGSALDAEGVAVSIAEEAFAVA